MFGCNPKTGFIKMGIQYDIVGKKFGKYTVLKRAPNRNTRQSWWECQCDCGIIKEVRGIKLVRNEIKSCGCWKDERDCVNTWQWQGCGEISKKYWSKLIKGALNRNYEFSLQIESAWDKFIQQNKKCALTNESICFIRNYHKQVLQTASLDRIDSNKGYFIDNIQWVHKDVNKLKNNLNQKTLLNLCYQIANKKSLSEILIIEDKIHTSKIWKGFGAISKSYWNSIKRAAINRNQEFLVSIEEAWQKFLDQKGTCVFTGEPICFVSDYSRIKSKQTASLDRIDSSKGYLIDNIQWVNKDINKIKTDFAQERFLELCFKIYNHAFYDNRML